MEASERGPAVETEQTRRVEDRRSVKVNVLLARPMWGDREVTVWVSSCRVDGGEWSPATVSIGYSGQSSFSVDDWTAIRDGVDAAITAYRTLLA